MKDIYELLNELNIDSSDIEEVDVNEIERKRGKRKLMNSLNRRKNYKKKISIAVACLLLVTSIVSVTLENPTWADNIPIIGTLVQKSLISVNKEYADYIDTINQTKSHEGIDVTFENAVADKNMFTFSFIVKNNNEPIEDPEIFDGAMTLKINGEEVNMSGVSECEVVNKNTVRYLWTVDWEDKDLPRYLNVNLDIYKLFNKSGDWGTKFTMNTKEIKNNTYSEKLSKEFSANNIDFSLEQISISPLTTNIKYYAKSNDTHIDADFLVLDQDNNEVKFMSGTSKDKNCDGGEEGKIKFSWNYINNSNITSLKLIPRYHDKNYKEQKIGSKEIDLNNFAPFKIKLTDNMSINIDDCILDNGNLIIRYHYEYLGKHMDQNRSIKDFDIKVDGIILEEDKNADELFKKYQVKDKKTMIYKLNNAKEIEMEFYDGAAKELLESEEITIIKK